MLIDKNDTLLAFFVQEVPENLPQLDQMVKAVFGDEVRYRNTAKGDDLFNALHLVEYNRYYTSVRVLISLSDDYLLRVD